ncbi:MAG: rhomboid family intramembrane serine protease [Polaribacter sp.]
MKDQDIHLKKNIITVPLLYILLIWFIYWIEIYFGFNFNSFGVFPRTLKGISGIFFTHFIHSDTNHLINNSIPLFVLTSSLFLFYKDIAWKVLIYGAILTGLLTWTIARPAYHIGASGVVYLLFSFISFSGIIRKHYRLVAIAMVIIFLYGSMVWYILPIKEGMSWEGHLSGFLIGLIMAFSFKSKGLVKTEYEFSKSEFDDYFDEEGNLKENLNPDRVED